jgi:hypothetical protein
VEEKGNGEGFNFGKLDLKKLMAWDVAQETLLCLGVSIDRACRLGFKEVMKYSRHFLVLFLLNFSAGADTILKTASEAALRDAVAAGGTIQFQFNGQIEVNQLEVIKPTVLDATGYSVTLYGAQKRILHVSSTFFAATNITFQGGADVGRGARPGPNNDTLERAVAGRGGAVLSENSELLFENCRFLNNGVAGGDGMQFTLNYPLNYIPFQHLATSGAPGEGGAVHLTNCSAFFQNCRFEGNVARGGAGTAYIVEVFRWVSEPGGSGAGGAIFALNSSIELHTDEFLHNNTVTGKIGDAHGGAIYVGGNKLTATHCKFRENWAIGGPSYEGFSGYRNSGGATEVYGTAEFNECLFVANTVRIGEGGSGATYGGAAYCFGRVHMDRCQLIQNSALGMSGGFENALGGALYLVGEYGLTNCTISGNSVKGGFGKYGQIGAGEAWFMPGSALGGGVYCGPGGGLVQFCTLVSNSATIFGPFPTPLPLVGGAGLAADTNSSVSIRGLIFSSNLCSNTNANIFGNLMDLGGNVSSDNSFALTATNSFNGVDPGLLELRTNGEFYYFFPLKSTSPAIDILADGFPAFDQLGAERPSGSKGDAGAIEYQGEEVKIRLRGDTGNFRLTVQNSSYSPVVISKSTDLKQWVPIVTNVAPVVDLVPSDRWRFFKVTDRP